MARYINSVRKPPRTLTDAEQALLLRTTGEHKDGFRDHMILSFALGTGLREHELAALDVGDVLNGTGRIKRRIQLRVFKRSCTEPAAQEVFLPDDLYYKVKKYIGWKRNRGESLAGNAPLFVSRRRGRLSTRTLRHLFQVWQERAGFEGRLFNFHSLRHSMLTNAYRTCRDITAVQRFARHKNINTTRIYTAPSDDELLAIARGLPC